MNTRTRNILAFTVAIVLVCAVSTASVNAAVLLSTDFSGISINGADPNTADGIIWTGTGMAAPTSLTLENVVANQNDGELFDHASGLTTTAGYFGGNTNLSRSPSDGQWGTTVTVTVGSGGASLEDVLINLTYGNSSGGGNSSSHTTQITATVFDNLNAVVGTVTSPNFSPTPASGADLTLTFGSPLALDANDTYTISFLVESNSGQGHYAAFNALAFNGAVLPEPATMSLLALGGLTVLRRRRK
ncbi:MAG: PEP-CTERM sorting domain-containing protein [Phycisphaerales bacterium]|nr:PEP-CTERM sorting domain-containing protein [Phycisphaerales bacterium]